MQKRPVLLVACLLFYIICAAQQYPFVHYTPKDGLINSRVRKAYQDSKGRMYFITYGGLSVYDGARFRNYTMQNGLLANLVNDVIEVSDDSLLVSANTCGLNVLVRGIMKRLDITGDTCPVINHFLKSYDGNIYATADNGLFLLNSKGLQKLTALIPGEGSEAVYLGLLAEFNEFLVFTSNELRKYKGLFLYNKKTQLITDLQPDLYVYSIKRDHRGSIWVSTNKSIAVLDSSSLAKGKLELRSPPHEYFKQDPYSSGTINFFSHNDLLLMSWSHGLIRYSRDGSSQLIILPEEATTVGKNSFIDREDVLWLCYDGNGIYKLANTSLQSGSSILGENKSGIRSIRTSADSTWLIMGNNEWILRSGGTSTRFHRSPDFNAYFLHLGEKNFYAADPHNLYIAPKPRPGERTISFKHILSFPDSISIGGWSVPDRSGNIIMFDSRNIMVIKDEKVLFTYPYPAYDLIEGMHIDKKQRLWIATRGNGLQFFSIHPEDPLHYLKKEIQYTRELENGSPRCMIADNNDILWIGTRFKGLMGFEYTNNLLKKRYHFQTHDGLTDNFVTTITCDRGNNIIVGTQTGLDRLIRTKDGFWLENITRSSNIYSYITYVWTDNWKNVFAWTNSGELLQVTAPAVMKDVAGPELLIEELKVNGRSISPTQTPLQLKYFQSNLNFSVAAPTFIDEKQVKYSWRLEGATHAVWSDTTPANAVINLMNISAGKYTLHVKAFFPSTAYADKELLYPFEVKVAWWRSWWFRSLASLVILSLLILSARFYYRRKLEKQRLILEKKQAVEKERTRIASDMHDDLGAGLSTIRFLSEKVKRNTFSDVTKDDAEKIVTNSNELVQKMNEIIWAMNEKNDTLEDLLFYTRSYAVEYCEENNLDCIVRLPASIPAVFVSGEIRRNVFLTIKESLHNIVKHAAAKKVIIDFSIDGSLSATIRDDGKGFMGNVKESGNGLRNMQKRIESVNGRFEIDGTNGVVVQIVVPLEL